jgi:Protein of unknown function (DUF4012)
LLIVAWAAVSAWAVHSAQSDLLVARDELQSLRRDASPSELLRERTTEALTRIEARLGRAQGRLGSPVLAPVKILPVVGRQVRSAESLTAAAKDATSVGAEALGEMGRVLEDARRPDTDRAALLGRIAKVSGVARGHLQGIDLGPGEALVRPLRSARDELAGELADLTEMLGDVERASGAVSEVLGGPGCHLLLAANNAEMRAGSGMFLQVGELCFEDGSLALGDLEESSDLVLPPDAVPIEDPDLQARWGHLLPNAEWRNLALTPRFDATAELASRMWQARTDRSVEGVLAVDPPALAVLLRATGPIVVGGERYHADTVVEQLLVNQYADFLEPGYDADDRKDRLGRVASAAVEAFDAGDWDLETLVEDLPDAAEGRHILAWSADPEIQAAWESLGVAGTLHPDSVAVSVLNRGGGRGGGKLDPALEIEARVRTDELEDGKSTVTIEVELRNTVRPGTPTYAEDPDADDVRFGVYQGILSVNVPGSAGELRIDGELAARGADGPTRVVATPLELGAGSRRTHTVTFRVPIGVRSLRIEPSARVPATRWHDLENDPFRDVRTRLLRW